MVLSRTLTYLAKLVRAIKHVVGRPPADIAVQWDHERYCDAGFHLKFFEIFNTLPRALDLFETESKTEILRKTRSHTLTARVRIAAMTSSDPPRIRLSGRSGSYSQIADVVSTAAIFVIWLITSIFPRLTTCPRHLEDLNFIFKYARVGIRT